MDGKGNLNGISRRPEQAQRSSGNDRQFPSCLNCAALVPAYELPSLRRYVRASRRGFTLLELLLSLVVFAAIASVALPGAAILLADRKIVRGGDQLRIEMTRARVDAMRGGRVMLIEATIGSNQFRIRPYFSASDSVETSGGSFGQSGLSTGADQAVVTAVIADPDATHSFEIPEELSVESVQVVSAARGAEISQAATFNQTDGGSESGGSQQWSQPIMFYPDGTTSTAAVTIADDVFGKVIVKIRGITGDVSVTEVSK